MKQIIRLGASPEVPDQKDFEESKTIQAILKKPKICIAFGDRGRQELLGTSAHPETESLALAPQCCRCLLR